MSYLSEFALSQEDIEKLKASGSIQSTAPVEPQKRPVGRPRKPLVFIPPKPCKNCGNPREQQLEGWTLFCSEKCRLDRAKEVKRRFMNDYYVRVLRPKYLAKKK